MLKSLALDALRRDQVAAQKAEVTLVRRIYQFLGPQGDLYACARCKRLRRPYTIIFYCLTSVYPSRYYSDDDPVLRVHERPHCQRCTADYCRIAVRQVHEKYEL